MTFSKQAVRYCTGDAHNRRMRCARERMTGIAIFGLRVIRRTGDLGGVEWYDRRQHMRLIAATLGCAQTVCHVIAEFSREAVSFSNAVASAYEDILKTGAKVERVEPDHLVSLSDIAERAGLTRQAISLYTRAERGAGFPNPVARVTSNSPLWDWLEVTEWLHAQAKIDREAVVKARIVKEANRFLELHEGQTDNFTRRLEMLEVA